MEIVSLGDLLVGDGALRNLRLGFCMARIWCGLLEFGFVYWLLHSHYGFVSLGLDPEVLDVGTSLLSFCYLVFRLIYVFAFVDLMGYLNLNFVGGCTTYFVFGGVYL